MLVKRRPDGRRRRRDRRRQFGYRKRLKEEYEGRYSEIASEMGRAKG